MASAAASGRRDRGPGVTVRVALPIARTVQPEDPGRLQVVGAGGVARTLRSEIGVSSMDPKNVAKSDFLRGPQGTVVAGEAIP